MIVAVFALMFAADESVLRAIEATWKHEFVLVEREHGGVVGARWKGERAAVGSLVKPFLALAAGEPWPVVDCRKGCWKPGGHGRLRMEQAIAHSCNVYFRALAMKTEPAAVRAVWEGFGVTGVTDNVSRATLYGAGGEWRFDAAQVAKAYVELLRRGGPLVKGMELAAKEGTAATLGRGYLAKTGTAKCSQDAGDGFAVVAWARYVLLVRVHNTTGAQAVVRVAPVVKAVVQ